MSEENATPDTGARAGFSLDGRTVDSGRPIEWLKRGWAIFLKNPGIWIAFTTKLAPIAPAGGA